MSSNVQDWCCPLVTQVHPKHTRFIRPIDAFYKIILKTKQNSKKKTYEGFPQGLDWVALLHTIIYVYSI